MRSALMTSLLLCASCASEGMLAEPSMGDAPPDADVAPGTEELVLTEVPESLQPGECDAAFWRNGAACDATARLYHYETLERGIEIEEVANAVVRNEPDAQWFGDALRILRRDLDAELPAPLRKWLSMDAAEELGTTCHSAIARGLTSDGQRIDLCVLWWPAETRALLLRVEWALEDETE